MSEGTLGNPNLLTSPNMVLINSAINIKVLSLLMRDSYSSTRRWTCDNHAKPYYPWSKLTAAVRCIFVGRDLMMYNVVDIVEARSCADNTLIRDS